ncbi:MAG: (E)-4-hydroxy-3-methylbut-2-enyl-diphosphate synthase [Verrucomicrobiota bacterium]|nr:(E)-4-hydroxy-3-methylbut-2-enyl-diphosphate synthase [Verrucomicrobiota bacterium]
MAFSYCASRFQSLRRKSRVVSVGHIELGGRHPIRVQSMTTTDTLDIQATARQSIELAEAGCEIVRITAPNVRAAESLGQIRKEIRKAKVDVPLVADIHFMPNAAMEAAKHVEKVRVNPGNYADRKKFQIREYTDSQYEEELERLHEEFSPLVLRCKELGRSMRIGTNHGSLSDRIMNRFGDTPRGMAESALEFIRIAESLGYRDIILSMKASNPKVMIQAYRLVVAMMNEEKMDYPLHLGVTEAGDGEDARIKSAIGIGSLLLDGLGDTIRVSLTEDPVAEIPVAQDLANRAQEWWSSNNKYDPEVKENIDPFTYTRRTCQEIKLGQPHLSLGDKKPPTVFVSTHFPTFDTAAIIKEIAQVQTQSKDVPVEGLIVRIRTSSEFSSLQTLAQSLVGAIPLIIVEDERENDDELPPAKLGCVPMAWHPSAGFTEEAPLARFLAFCDQAGHYPIISLPARELSDGTVALLACSPKSPLITLAPTDKIHTVAGYRVLATSLSLNQLSLPLWIRTREKDRLFPGADYFSARLLDASILSGSLLCDGIGDLISVENMGSLDRNRGLAYNLLQGSRARVSKTEFVACPSCGRTQFDLQSTTQRVKQATGHLKGVTIAVMGCIVNGPGEMADADFGYVGSGPGKIDLYVGKNRVKSAITENDAVDRLIDLIVEEGKWIDP